jgi:SAM-dependent methyltransferase
VSSDGFAYTGADELEVMTEAVNYNRFLCDAVLDVVRPGDRVLDFGAGPGTFADMMAARGVIPDCLEPDQRQQQVLASKGYLVLDHDTWTEQRGTYDVVYLLNVLEHIKNDQEATEQIAELLTPGGRVVIYVPAFESLFSSLDHKVEHFRRYRRPQLLRIVRNAGLRVESAYYCDPLGFFATLVYKAGPNDEGTINVPALKLFDRAAFPLSRALHPVTGKLFGKNIMLVASKAPSGAGR